MDRVEEGPAGQVGGPALSGRQAAPEAWRAARTPPPSRMRAREATLRPVLGWRVAAAAAMWHMPSGPLARHCLGLHGVGFLPELPGRAGHIERLDTGEPPGSRVC